MAILSKSLADGADFALPVLADGGLFLFDSGLADLLQGGEGADSLRGEGGADSLHGLGGSDVLDGGAGNDLLAGGAGHDVLIGGLGHDTQQGGDGDDLLVGGAGRDVMSGGKGRDIYRWEALGETGLGAARDVVKDLTREDRLDFSRLDARPDLAGDQAFVDIGARAFAAGSAGLVRVVALNPENTLCLMQFEIDGDGLADFEVLIHSATAVIHDVAIL